MNGLEVYEREGEVILLPEDGRQCQPHSSGGEAVLQGQGELQLAGHGGHGQLALDVAVGVQSQHTFVVRQGEDVSAGHGRAETDLKTKNRLSASCPPVLLSSCSPVLPCPLVTWTYPAY